VIKALRRIKKDEVQHDVRKQFFFLQANMYVAEKTVNIVCRVTSSVRLKVGLFFIQHNIQKSRKGLVNIMGGVAVDVIIT